MDMVATTSEMLMLSPAMVTVAIAGQATHTMDMVATTSEMLMLSLAMEVMVMEATPGSAMATDMVMATVATAMVTVAIAGQATPTIEKFGNFFSCSQISNVVIKYVAKKTNTSKYKF